MADNIRITRSADNPTVRRQIQQKHPPSRGGVKGKPTKKASAPTNAAKKILPQNYLPNIHSHPRCYHH